MKITFSRHARRQMKWRKIDEQEVREAVSNPERMEGTIKGRKNAFKMIGGRLLKVTYRRKNDDVIVITTVVKGE
jgi:hypothetical protein